jgi:hypothetical protein
VRFEESHNNGFCPAILHGLTMAHALSSLFAARNQKPSHRCQEDIPGAKGRRQVAWKPPGSFKTSAESSKPSQNKDLPKRAPTCAHARWQRRTWLTTCNQKASCDEVRLTYWDFFFKLGLGKQGRAGAGQRKKSFIPLVAQSFIQLAG